MREERGDLFAARADAIAIPTNRLVAKGKLITGAGVAFEASRRWTWLPHAAAKRAETRGAVVVEWFDLEMALIDQPDKHNEEPYRYVVTFPTKDRPDEPSSLALIERSAHELVRWTRVMAWRTVALPRVGAGLGRLDWNDVRSILTDVLDDRFVVLTP